jgi:RNase P subunit RPR2
LVSGIFHREEVPKNNIKRHIMREPDLDLEIDDRQRAILVVECPECGDKSRFLLDEVSPGTSVLCNCGGVLNLPGDSLQSIRKKSDNTQKIQD